MPEETTTQEQSVAQPLNVEPPKPTETHVPKTRFDEVIAERNALRDRIKAETESKLLEQGKYKELLEAREKELNEFKEKLTQREFTDLKRRIMAESGLSPDLADVVNGNTEDELKANVTKLLALVGTQRTPAPTSPNGALSGPASTSNVQNQAPVTVEAYLKMTPEQQKIHAPAIMALWQTGQR